MKHLDSQLGRPEILYTNTKANIEAMSGLSEGSIAYASDTDQIGTYSGSVWTWGAGSSSTTVTQIASNDYAPGPKISTITANGNNKIFANQGGWHHASIVSRVVNGKEWQVYGFFNNDSVSKLCLAVRQIPNPFTVYTTAETYPGTADGHNAITVGLDFNGYIHICWGMHDIALRYKKSTLPIDQFAGTLSANLSMLGTHESTVTYPGFFNDPAGELYFTFRDGDSIHGNQYFYKYNYTTASWAAMAGTGSAGLLCDSITDGGSIYVMTPVFDANFGSGGKMHFFFEWEVSYNYPNLGYVSWDGTNWKKSDGSAQTIPIRSGNDEHAVDLGNTTIQSSMLNQGVYSDSSGHPHLILNKDDGSSVYATYHIWHNGTSWIKTLIPLIPASDTSHNAGMPIVVMDRSKDVLYAVYTHYGEGNTQIYYLASAPGDYTKWTKGIVYPFETDATKACLYQPKVDINRWDRSKTLDIPIEPMDATTSTLPIYLMEYTPSGWGLADALRYPGLHTNDKDSGLQGLHHSIGWSSYQVAAGNHIHPSNVVATASHSASPLTIPTYDGSGQATHPDVYYNPNKWNGYEYWMVMTPAPAGAASYENPSILCSHDGTTWVVPAGLTNPIDPYPGSPDSNSDTDIIVDGNGVMWCFYLWSVGTTYDRVMVRSSSDGVNWSAETQCFQVTYPDAESPSVIWDGSQYVCYYVNAIPSPNTLAKRTSPTPIGPWSSEIACAVNGVPSGKDLWHIDVIFRGSVYHAFVTLNVLNSTSGVCVLYFATSPDGTNWTLGSSTLLSANVGGWADNSIYRSSGIPTPTGYDLWYPCWKTNSTWAIGRTKVVLSESTSVPALSSLPDVVLSSLADTQVLAYDSGLSKWKNINAPTGGDGGITIGGGDYGAYLLQKTVVAAGGQATIDISSIPTGYDRIEIRIEGRVTSATDNMKIAFNNDTTDANYFGASHYAGTSAGAAEQASRQICDIGSNAGSNVGGGLIIIDNYDNTTLWKSARSISGSLSAAGNNDSYVSDLQLAWKNTAAINRITLAPSVSGNFAEGTTCVVIAWKYLGAAGNFVDDGWKIADAMTYASADGPTFTMTCTGDQTGKYGVGMRVKLTQTTAKYFIITKVSYSSPNITITLYGGTDYTLENAGITLPYYSREKAPVGFPLSPIKWTVRVKDGTSRNKSSGVASIWYNVDASHVISIPIGSWKVRYQACVALNKSSSAFNVYCTLSTTNNGQSDNDFTATAYVNLGAHTPYGDYLESTMYRSKTLDLTSKTSYYFNVMSVTTAPAFFVNSYTNDTNPLLLEAECAYL